MTTLTQTLTTVEQAERRVALRSLLVRPLQSSRGDPERFKLLVRHRAWLVAWFREHPGWTLVIDRAAGIARLRKQTARPGAWRPARSSRAGLAPFDRRRYSLLCVALAAIDGLGAQTSLAHLAERVEALSQDEEGLQSYDATRRSERSALVDSLRLLERLGVLRLRDGETERYARSREHDALYDINDRVLGQLVVSPAGGEDVYPDTEEGRKLRARHAVFRVLLDEPALYHDELDEDQRRWLDQSRGFVYRQLLENVGLAVERRQEGIAAVDPAGELTDERFPDGDSTAKHAALLLAELFVDRVKAGRAGGAALEVSLEEVERWVAVLMEDFGERCRWSRQYVGQRDGIRRLAADACRLLAGFGLLAHGGCGWRPRPALARFAPAVPGRQLQSGGAGGRSETLRPSESSERTERSPR